MAENLIHQFIPHQGCVIARTVDGIEISGSAMNWVMWAGVAPLYLPCPFHLPRGRHDGLHQSPDALASGRTDLQLGMLNTGIARA